VIIVTSSRAGLGFAGLLAMLALLLPATAGAKPLTLNGAGSDPHIAVDEAGTGHVVWNDSGGDGDDVLRYCRLPRGASKCAKQQAFGLPGRDFEGPRALYADGLLTIVDNRCCFPGDRVMILESTDRGGSFSFPRAIASPPNLSSYSPLGGGGNAIYGPGINQISTVGSGTGGTYFQAASTAGGASAGSAARVDDDVAGSIAYTTSPSAALFDPLTPLVAYAHIDTDKVYVRAWDGAGSYNSSANWAPSRALRGKADDPRLASGRSGAYLIYRSGKPTAKRYRVRRVNAFGFGEPVDVSAKGAPIFRDFSQDAGGNLHAAWVDNGDPDRLRYSNSTTGKRFSKPAQLAKGRDNMFGTAVAAGPDGGGWALWVTKSGIGKIKAAPFGPIGGGGGDGGGGSEPCVPKLTYGKIVVLARQGCLQKSGETYSTPDPIRVNGVDIDPVGSAGAEAAASEKIVIDVGKGTLKSGGTVTAKAGNFKLDERKLGWKLPKSGGEIRDLAGNPATFATGKLNKPLLGLPVSGQTRVSIDGGAAARIPIHLGLPEPFGGLLGNAVTADAVLRLDNARGLILDDLHLTAESIWLGIAEVTDLELEYSQGAGDVFTGKASILMPVARSKLNTDFGLARGEFDYGRADLEFTPALPVVGQFVLLQEIDFEILTNPTKLAGGVVMTAGPKIPAVDTAAATLDGNVSYTFPNAPQGGVFLAKGDGDIAGLPTANMFVRFETPDLVSFGGSFVLPPGGDPFGGFGPELRGSASGKLDVSSGNFNIEGSGRARGIPLIPFEIGVQALLSRKALAACGTVDLELETVAAGFGLYWGGSLTPFVGCNLSPFRSEVAAKTAVASTTFTIPKDLPQAGVRISGAGAPPRVTLTGPAGQKLSMPSGGGHADNEVGAIGPFVGSNDTYAVLVKPQAGAWTASINEGSAEITTVATAEGLPNVKVKARVKRRKGRKRELRYDARRIDGQRISFYETGKGVHSLLGRSRGGKGKLGFSAADGPKGKRRIVAAVESFGAPREQLNVAAYKAPGPIKPSKPRRLRARRKGGKLVLSWRRSRGAKRYLVATRLRDGRRLELTTRKRRLKIPDVPRIDSAKIRVAGLKADNTPGPVARAKLKAKPKKRGKKGKR
jgi:hypothetical protein